MSTVSQLICTLLMVCLLPTTLLTDVYAYELFTRDSNPFGRPYSHWFEDWLKWWFIAADNNLTSKLNNNECIAKLDGPVVFFMSPSQVGPQKKVMSCEISSDQGILFTFLVGECDTEQSPKNSTYAKLLQCAIADNVATTNFTGSIDGVPITQKDIQVIDTDKSNFNNFKLEVNKNNRFGMDAGTYNAAAEGNLVFVKPLPVGQHTIEQKTVITNAEWAFTGHMVYQLNVTK